VGGVARAARWRYLTSDSVGAAEGLATDEALMAGFGREATSAYAAALRLYTYRPHCALVGRYQSVADEVDLEFCAAHGVEVGRRPTGGGAIIMGSGQLGVAICARARADEPPRDALRGYADGVIAGLAALGVEAQFRSKNDLEVGGKKIAGLGLHLDSHGGLLFHASVLVGLDVELMLRILRIPGAKVADKGVSKVADRITTLERELGTSTTAAEVRECFAAGLARAFDADLVADTLTEAEESLNAQRVESRYANPEWTFERSARSDTTGSALLKTPEGLLRIHAGLHGEMIKSILLAGDFNTLPPGVARLERALKWCRADRQTIGEMVAGSRAPEELGVAAEAIADVIFKATLSARRRNSYPRRTAGSCYFPESGSTGPTRSSALTEPPEPSELSQRTEEMPS